jgi:hypothetical protein
MSQYFAVVKIFTSDGTKIGIAEMPVNEQYSYRRDLSEGDAAAECHELAELFGIPEYIGDSLFIDYEELTPEEREFFS